MSSAPWTIGRLLAWTTDYLKQHGSESPRLEAEVLLAAARKCQRIELYTAFEDPASEELRTSFRALVKQRAEGKPVAYLVGHREFYSLKFRVTPEVLIPRPETEFLVVRMLDLVKERPAGSTPAQVADVGTGSGIIAVCAAKHGGCQVTAIDLSPQALEVARGNAQSSGVADRITFVESDLFSALPPEQKFDIIASNPPYISDAELAELPRDVKDFEPRLALSGGERGTSVIERLIPQAAERLVPGGWLLIEISPMIDAAVKELLSSSGAFDVGATVKDLAGLARVVQAQRK